MFDCFISIAKATRVSDFLQLLGINKGHSIKDDYFTKQE
jgi:hypothetical protein